MILAALLVMVQIMALFATKSSNALRRVLGIAVTDARGHDSKWTCLGVFRPFYVKKNDI
jgi:hypothetical protein